MTLSRFVTLWTGAKMPTLGLGTYLGQGPELKSAIDYALSIGYRHLDTALSYQNHHHVGEVLKENIHQGKMKRRDIFLTTKIPPYLIGSQSDIDNFVSESLESLKTNYVDMLLIHYPFATERGDPWSDPDKKFVHLDIVAAWKRLENVVKDGQVKAIGLSNFTQNQMERILSSADIKPANLQFECHAYNQQKQLREFCNSQGIVVTAYSPIGGPGRHERQVEPGDKELIQDPVVQNIAVKLQRTPAQILLRFLIQSNIFPLPKSITPLRIKENFGCYDFSLNKQMMEALCGLDCGQRYFRFRWAEGHPEYMYNTGEAF